jgi:hypothetical protein
VCILAAPPTHSAEDDTMDFIRNHFALIIPLLAAFVATVSTWAVPAKADAYIYTGEGIRTKSIAFVKVKVYVAKHEMKQAPAQKSKRAVIDMDTDKRITLTMLRDVDAEKMRDVLKEAYQKNGFNDGRVGTLLAAFAGEAKEKSQIVFSYDAASKTVTLQTNSGRASATGVDFMKATWSIWFGNIDQPELGDQMISRL